jgi:hypothetical protein
MFLGWVWFDDRTPPELVAIMGKIETEVGLIELVRQRPTG